MLMDPVLSSESCWGEMEDLVGEENADWGLMPCPTVPFQEPCATRRDTDSVSVGLVDHGSRGHENDFSTLLDGLEEDLGVSRVVDPATVPAPPGVPGVLPGVLPVVHRVVVPPRSGRRVVLVPNSPDATPQSIHNSFAVLADEDSLTGQGLEEFAVANAGRVRFERP